MILTRYVTACQLLVKQKRWINYQRQSFFVFENAELFQESVLGDRGSPRHRTGRRKQVSQQHPMQLTFHSLAILRPKSFFKQPAL